MDFTHWHVSWSAKLKSHFKICKMYRNSYKTVGDRSEEEECKLGFRSLGMWPTNYTWRMKTSFWTRAWPQCLGPKSLWPQNDLTVFWPHPQSLQRASVSYRTETLMAVWVPSNLYLRELTLILSKLKFNSLEISAKH